MQQLGAEEQRRENRLVRAVNGLGTVGAAAAALAVLALMALICLEVFMRNFLGRSTMVSDEWSGYLYGAIVFLGAGKTLRDGGFIRVEALYDRFRGRTLTTARWTFVVVTMIYVAVLLADAVRQVVYLYTDNIRSDSLTQTPLYVPESLMVVGWALLLLQLVTYVVKGMRDVP